ncbi:EAL domain-containing protein [Catenovulum sp. 2E275]|uniref:bifunctional diguanylate cyclase/phosphodiesterase n=1 Tax=Catenovulum sp. 2E275 TaxID=2980497 RepID=UPI0021CE19FB|nr:EAL domain-containing protein [Catenovulum sp. 2E275]MCU4675518.1 EAL domain-containing protein [Catenovulum sp. 2E275]
MSLVLASGKSFKSRHLKKLLGLKRQASSLQTALLEIADLTRLFIEPKDFYYQLHEIIASLIKAPDLYIVFKNQTNQQFELVYYASQLRGVLDNPHFSDGVIEFGLTGYLFRTQTALLCNPDDYRNLVELGEVLELGEPAVSWLGVPLTLNDGTCGAIVIQSHQTEIHFSQQDLIILSILAKHITQAIDMLNQQVQLEHEMHSRTKALQVAHQALKEEAKLKQQYQLAHKLLLELNETFDFSLTLDDLYQAIAQIVEQIFSPELHYIAVKQLDGHWHYPAVNRTPFITSNIHLQFNSLNQYFSIDPLPIFLRSADVHHLNQLGALAYVPDIMIKNSHFSWQAVQLQNEQLQNEQMPFVLIGMVRSEAHFGAQSEQLEALSFLATHFNLILQKWHTQARLAESHKELEQVVQERTQQLNQVNQDLNQQIKANQQVQAKLYHDANHDNLTGLPNRQLFNRNLLNALAQNHLNNEIAYSVLFIDLDRFKLINDTFGHLIGDQFLIEVSQKIAQCVPENAILARMGGDEFVILLQGENASELSQDLAQEIINTINVSFDIDGHDIFAGCSLGITTSEQAYKKPSDILRDADTAMYQAKKLGRGRFVVFDQSLHEALKAQLATETELRNAIKQKRFIVDYQPVVDLTDNSVVAVESQIYWQHPKDGLVNLQSVIELAEQTELIFDIDFFALEQALTYLKPEQGGKSAPSALMSVNLDGLFLNNQARLTQLINVLQASQVDLHYLILEFSEQSLTDAEQAIESLNRLAEAGVRIALDQFGAQFGSMAMLFKADIDFIKLDKKLIKDLAQDLQLQRYAQSVVNIGKDVGFITIADGVDNEQGLLNANAIGCSFAQGQFIAPAQQLAQILADKTTVYFNKSRKLAM